MKTFQRTLAILAAVCLLAQTVRHAHILWFEPRESVLDKYDRPLEEEIAAALGVTLLIAGFAEYSGAGADGGATASR